MSVVSSPAVSGWQPRLRPGLVLRLLGLAALATFVAVNGEAIKTRVLEGETHSYTAVVLSGADQDRVAAQVARIDGVKVENTFVGEDLIGGFTVSASDDDARTILANEGVSHIVIDHPVKVDRGWWDELMMKANL